MQNTQRRESQGRAANKTSLFYFLLISRLASFLFPKMRASWYFVCEMVRQDVMAQRLGLVCIAQNTRPCHPEAFGVVQIMAKRRRGWPVNLAVTHYCSPKTEQMVYTLPLVQLAAETNVRRKFRAHFGGCHLLGFCKRARLKMMFLTLLLLHL